MTLMLALVLPAHAYETDNLTFREQPLTDVSDPASERVDEAIAEAVAWTNDRTGCEEDDPDRIRRLLARAIHELLASDQIVTDRGPLRSRGFDVYSAWIETGDLDRRRFLDRDDIFGGLTPRESVFLRFAGTCSTVNVNGHLVGTDKLDHFFEEGYDAWRKGDFGEDPITALEWATRTEMTKYGLQTSKTFSFADLRADYDGYVFYDTLFEEGNALQLDEEGCVEQVRPWDWAEWVTWEYDEVLNPSVHTPLVQRGLTRWLAENRDRYCASYASWGGAWYEEHLDRVLSWVPHYVVGEHPERTDPYDLPGLCADWGDGS